MTITTAQGARDYVMQANPDHSLYTQCAHHTVQVLEKRIEALESKLAAVRNEIPCLPHEYDCVSHVGGKCQCPVSDIKAALEQDDE